MDIKDIAPEDLEVLRARHKEIKEARRTFLKTILGLSGGSIVLSITFLKDIAPDRHWLPLLFVAWFFFSVSVCLSLFELWQLVRVSIVHQLDILERYLTKPLEARNLMLTDSQFVAPIHFYALVFFGCGVVCFAFFSVRNALN